MITEAQTLAADIPTDGSYDMCSYILDFDTRNCTEFTLQTPYNNRPVYVLTTIGDTCYVATDYKRILLPLSLKTVQFQTSIMLLTYTPSLQSRII